MTFLDQQKKSLFHFVVFGFAAACAHAQTKPEKLHTQAGRWERPASMWAAAALTLLPSSGKGRRVSPYHTSQHWGPLFKQNLFF